jgi:predicted kinase
MNRLYVMVGIPASGKSTWARRHLPGWVIVSTDEIREELFGSAETRRDPKLVFGTAHQRIIQALRSGRDVVYDATNTVPATRANLLRKLKAEGLAFEAVAIVLETRPEQAIAQQANRARQVPPAAIRRFHRTFRLPSVKEGFSEIKRVSDHPGPAGPARK